MLFCLLSLFFFFFNDPAPTEIYPLPLPDALPICSRSTSSASPGASGHGTGTGAHRSCRCRRSSMSDGACSRSEEHTSELQSQSNLVCRLLLEKKKKTDTASVRAPTETLIPPLVSH